ncbi:B3 domain-containing protein Os02g0598200 [Ziziphus jujuba]|uniref:B3 domain-containing protein Os02g0598200 n=1 Tax=Ziziphus jujuba TaxID=326968 RepID=A0A6P6G628_ZIZJJ|nr:B3 domain-containing protein Os02g0598200 [Ziziphus jujuba]XP_048328934.1 B3 domain-containing protein Os02g0598200 [Ziziphus jujuba]
MCSKEEACVQCIQNCLKFHGKKEESSPAVTSFFKILIGPKFSEVLFLPPKFARSMPELINQNAILEDSSGSQWEVTISNVDGFLAFQQGWNDFSLAHNLEVGYFLVFQYLMKSHLFVKIFDTSGCEKLDFSERSNQRKRKRDDGDTVKENPRHTNDRSKMNKQDSSSSPKSGSNAKISEGLNEVNNAEEAPSVSPNLSNGSNMSGRRKVESEPENIDDTFQMVYRDLGTQQGEDRCPVIDLSDFEMWNDKSGGVAPQHVDQSMRSQNEVSMTDNNPAAKDAACLSVPLDASNSEKVENCSNDMDRKVISDNDTCIDEASGHCSPVSSVKPQENVKSLRKFTKCQLAEGSDSEPLSGKNRGSLSQKVESSINDSCQSAKSKFTKTPSSSVGTQNYLSVKKELIENTSDACETHGESSKVKDEHQASSDKIVEENNDVDSDLEIKTETDDSVGIPPDSSDVPSVVATAGSEPFLELPACLPYTSIMGRSKMDRTVVVLRDPERRLWSVMYHETSSYCVLTSGWEAFTKANSVQPKDECVFVVENDSKGIYKVRIVRK